MELPEAEYYGNSRNVFLHGVVQGHGGTCTSLPAAYVAVGQRLGYPLKIVKTARHCFARWDEPGGERFNIECTCRGFMTYPDEHYRHWPFELTADDEQFFGLLRSLTPLQEMALFLCQRGHCMRESRPLAFAEVVECYARAADMDPADPSYMIVLEREMNRWDADQLRRLMPGFPPMRIYPSPRRRYAHLPLQVENDLAHLRVKELVLGDPRADQAWWQPLRTNPNLKPPCVPALIIARFASWPCEEVEVGYHRQLPQDYNPVNPLPC
jgi:hypothetical protein